MIKVIVKDIRDLLLMVVLSFCVPSLLLIFGAIVAGFLYVFKESNRVLNIYYILALASQVVMYSSRSVFKTDGDDIIRYYERYKACSTSMSQCYSDYGLEVFLPSLHYLLPIDISPNGLLLIYTNLGACLIYLIFKKLAKNNSKDQSKILFLLFNVFIFSGSFFLLTQLVRATLSCLFIIYFIKNRNYLLLLLAFTTHLYSIISLLMIKTLNNKYLILMTILTLIIFWNINEFFENLINFSRPFFPELISKADWNIEMKGTENLSQISYLLIIFPGYAIISWLTKKWIPITIWLLMLAADFFLTALPLLSLRGFLILFFSGPILLASMIDCGKVEFYNNEKLILIISIIFTYMLLFYKVYVNIYLYENLDFKLFDAYSPVEPIFSKFFLNSK